MTNTLFFVVQKIKTDGCWGVRIAAAVGGAAAAAAAVFATHTAASASNYHLVRCRTQRTRM